MIGRVALGAAGAATMGYGVVRLWFGHQVGDPVRVLEWLVGAIVIHDFGIAPLAIGVGYLLTRVVPGWARSIVQGGLLVAGSVLIVAIPLIIKPVPSIPTVLPLDYPRNLAIVLGAVAFGTAALIALRGWQRGWHRRQAAVEAGGTVDHRGRDDQTGEAGPPG